MHMPMHMPTGLRLLARGFHGASSGWNASGPPSSVLRRMRVSPGWMHAYTTTVASTNEDPRAVEVRAVSKAVSKAMRGFDAAWTFAYADSDQGLFVYMLLLHQPAAAFARANIGKATAHTMHAHAHAHINHIFDALTEKCALCMRTLSLRTVYMLQALGRGHFVEHWAVR